MAIAVTVTRSEYDSALAMRKGHGYVTGTINLGDTYAAGGVAITAAALEGSVGGPPTTIHEMVIEPSTDLTTIYTFDKANLKIKARSTSSVTAAVAETVAIASNTGDLAFTPLAITAVEDTGTTPVGPLSRVVGAPAAGQYAASGATLTTNNDDAIDELTVWYLHDVTEVAADADLSAAGKTARFVAIVS